MMYDGNSSDLAKRRRTDSSAPFVTDPSSSVCQGMLTHWTKKIIVEEGHTMAQLVHILWVDAAVACDR